MPPPVAAAAGRATWERAADRLLLAVRRHAGDRHALIHLPGPASISGRWSDGLEGYARTFLLAAFRLAGVGGDDPHRLAEWYAEGLAAGVDPGSPERWPAFAERHQAKVEAASIAIALHETRPWIWDRLDPRTQQQLHDWLADMVGDEMPGNNWIWFQAVTEAFARTTGGRWRAADLDRTIDLTESWYAGDGWYSDGLSGGEHRNFDHYNGWAMHFYPLWYCRILGDLAPAGLLDRYRARLRRFLADHRHLIGGNGSPLIQGRSLTYRFAALAPLWTGALFDATPLPPGETRRLAGGMLDHFTGHGAIDDDGLLTLGWHRPFRPILQAYSGPASPYWASKGFAGLLLPSGHPVWADPGGPAPAAHADVARTLEGPGWLVSGTAADGVVRVLNHGGDHTDPARLHSDDPLYARLAYSTHTAPDTPADPRTGSADSAVALVDAEGLASHRRPLRRIAVAGHVGISRSRAHWPDDPRWNCFGGPDTGYRTGPWITVASVLRGTLEIRLVRVDAAGPEEYEYGGAAGHHPGPWRLRLGGWAVPGGTVSRGRLGRHPYLAVASDNGLNSAAVALRGFDLADAHRATGSNALGSVSTTPVLWTAGQPEFGTVHAAAVHLGGAPLAAEQLPRLELSTADGAAAAQAVVRWPDGSYDTVVLPAPGARGG